MIIKTSSKTGHSKLISTLVDMGYTRVQLVLEFGDFAVRGSIIDIYPINRELPVRLEFEDDQIERITEFHPQTQRSLQTLTSFQLKEQPSKPTTPSEDPLPIHHPLLLDLQLESPVVHETYGIGIYKGLHYLNLSGREGEFIWIQYKGEDRVFVPIEQTHLLHTYSGGDAEPTIHGLFDGYWNRMKERAMKSAELYVQDLYELYLQRKESSGFCYAPDTPQQKEFEDQFPYAETPDQLRAIAEIKEDMESPKIMDRLLCGDVGYGKTEVILRAVFKALENEKQVAVLVPTTLLAEQHYELFVERLHQFPYRVEVLSRFQSKEKQKVIIKGLQEGTVDLVIGTHRLIQNDIKFSHLGFIVVDEEQRFGVSHKEKLKHLQSEVDVLSVSATPIPRTLYMSLSGARDLTCIETPPRKRLPVVTHVLAYDEERIKDAIQKELQRKGQVFFLHNRVSSILKTGKTLKTWFPNAEISIAHGQMQEDILQDVMMEFWSGKTDILVSTTIIENGIDVPRANTIIIDSAEKYGLAQIHQLRGRVGRSEIQGYAYLFYDKDTPPTSKVAQRLDAIKSYVSLGAGYQLALKDLEIRGAGAVLGNKQHGNMVQVGFELYCKLLNQAVKKAKKEKIQNPPAIVFSPKMKAYIPDTYVENEQERLTLYRRLMSLTHQSQLDDLVEEIEDRYGKLPKLVEILLTTVRAQLY